MCSPNIPHLECQRSYFNRGREVTSYCCALETMRTRRSCGFVLLPAKEPSFSTEWMTRISRRICQNSDGKRCDRVRNRGQRSRFDIRRLTDCPSAPVRSSLVRRRPFRSSVHEKGSVKVFRRKGASQKELTSGRLTTSHPAPCSCVTSCGLSPHGKRGKTRFSNMRPPNKKTPRTMLLRHIVRRRPVQNASAPPTDTCGSRRLEEAPRRVPPLCGLITWAAGLR